MEAEGASSPALPEDLLASPGVDLVVTPRGSSLSLVNISALASGGFGPAYSNRQGGRWCLPAGETYPRYISDNVAEQSSRNSQEGSSRMGASL